MNWQDFGKTGKEVIDFIIDYMENIRSYRTFPSVKPGYMRPLLPEFAPEDGESFDRIFQDMIKVVLPGLTHWQSPHMHAYFPALNCPASILGDLLADSFGCLGFTWASSPACTELETIVMDWLASAIGLPEEFLHRNRSSKGGGALQTTSSEATFVALLAARTEVIRRLREEKKNQRRSESDDEFDEDDGADACINTLLVGYASDQAHSSVEKAGLIGLVRMRYVESDGDLRMRGDRLLEAIEEDKERGLIPFFVCATLGTTGACAFDDLTEVGPIAKQFNLWLHVDAAYAGSAFICPENRIWMKGVEMVDSFAFNPSKWLMVHFDCTAFFVKDSSALHRTFNVEPLYLQHENSGHAVDFMHWQVPLSKRFRALKLWFVLRNFGIKGLQQHIRSGVRLAKEFALLVKTDDRFEIPSHPHLGLVTFRLKGDNSLTEKLLKKLNSDGNIHCVPASLKGLYVIRFTVTSTRTTSDDILRDWMIIRSTATQVLTASEPPARISLREVKKRSPGFGTSLLLSNSPMTPKVINASFVALFEHPDIIQEFVKQFGSSLNLGAKTSPGCRRRLKGLMVSDKQFSLDSRMDIVNTLVASIPNKEASSRSTSNIKRSSEGK